jgi:hypothetical protein
MKCDHPGYEEPIASEASPAPNRTTDRLPTVCRLTSFVGVGGTDATVFYASWQRL